MFSLFLGDKGLLLQFLIVMGVRLPVSWVSSYQFHFGFISPTLNAISVGVSNLNDAILSQDKFSSEEDWVKKGAIWIFLVIIFATVKIIRLENENTVFIVVDSIIFMTLSYWFLISYIAKESMRVPGYSFELARGKDDLLRTLSFATTMVVLSVILFT